MRAPRAAAAALVLSACGSTEPDGIELTRQELLDPETCAECHPKHYEEWSGSMHAYASFDPVFRAMNERGQEETADREQPLGDFCVSCHAPMAVREGATTDGLNLDDLPKHLQGITCYFCHNVESVEGTHNNPLVLSNDRTMRGGIRDPLKNTAHKAEYSELLDGRSLESSKLCGACHDIVVPKEVSGNEEDVHLERTYAEYLDNAFNGPIEDGGLTCGGCHALGTRDGVLQPIADYDGVKPRRRHEHGFPGIDVAITDFPDQSKAVRDFIDVSLRSQLCVNTNGYIQVELDNFQSGHSYPSGASQDRRVWAEVIAYDADGEILDAWGKVEPGEPIANLDPSQLMIFHDVTLKKDGTPAHMFWDVAEIDAQAIPGPKTTVVTDPAYDRPIVRKNFTSSAAVERVTLRIRIEPIGLDVLDDLVDSGHLAQVHRDAQIVHDVLPSRNAPPEAGLARDVTLEWVRRPEDVQLLDESRCIESAGSRQID